MGRRVSRAALLWMTMGKLRRMGYVLLMGVRVSLLVTWMW